MRIYVSTFDLDDLNGGAEKLGQQISTINKLKYFCARKLGIEYQNQTLRNISDQMDKILNNMPLDLVVHNSTNCRLLERNNIKNVSVCMEIFEKEGKQIEHILPDFAEIKKTDDWNYQKEILLKSDKIVLLSSGEYDYLYDKIEFSNMKNKLFIIEPYIEDIFKRNKDIKKKYKRILYVGKRHPRKGWHIINDLIKNLDDSYEIRLITEGNLSVENLIKEYNEATVCLIPSLYESYCYVMAESIMCGTPVITNRIGFAEKLKNNEDYGIYFPDNNNIDGYINKIEEIKDIKEIELNDNIKYKFSKERFKNEWSELLNNW